MSDEQYAGSHELIDAKLKAEIDKLKAERESQLYWNDRNAREWELKLASMERHEILEKLQYQTEYDIFQRSKAEHFYRRLVYIREAITSDTATHYMERLNEFVEFDKVTNSPKKDIEIILTSPGGSIIAGFALYDRIQQVRRLGYHVTVGTLGYAASMAGVLLQAGDTRWIGREAVMLIHEATTIGFGKLSEIKNEAKFTELLQDRLVRILAERSVMTEVEINKAMQGTDWWLTSEDVIALGFADEVR